MTEQFNSGESSFIFGINFHKYSTGRMIVGKYAWQQEEDQKEDISTALIFQEQLFTSELFRDTLEAILLILRSLQDNVITQCGIIPSCLPYRMCFLIFIRSSTTD